MAKFSVCRIYKVTLWLKFSYNYSVNLLQILPLSKHRLLLPKKKADVEAQRPNTRNNREGITERVWALPKRQNKMADISIPISGPKRLFSGLWDVRHYPVTVSSL